MIPKEQVPKFTCTSTVTSSRTLVKPDKVFQKDSLKASQNIHPKETFMKSFSSVTSQPGTSLKKNRIAVIFQ